MWKILTVIFNVVGLVLLFQFLRFKWRDYQQSNHLASYWTFKRHKYILTLGGLLAITMFLIEYVLPGVSPLQDQAKRLSFGIWLGGLTSLGISLTWAVYLWKLDVFEPEKWYPTGQLNFSLVKEQILNLSLTPCADYARQVRVYALSHNILRVSEGTAQTLFDLKY